MINIAKSTVDSVLENTEEDISVHVNYSGRGMYGEECLAIEYRKSISDAFMFMFELATQIGADENEGEDQDEYSIRDNLNDLLQQPPRMDNLGNNGLIYWPHIQISE